MHEPLADTVEAQAPSKDMGGDGARKSTSVGSGLGVYGGSWGAAPYKNHPHLWTAQVLAAVLDLWPLLIGYFTYRNHGCTYRGGCAFGVLLSWVACMPLSI